MIIYRIFFGFCWICVCFLYIHVSGSKACAAPHLGHSSLPALFRHAHRYYFKFFCTQENSFPFPFVLKWCVFISPLQHPLPFTGLSLGCGPAVHSLLRAVLTVCNITFSSFSASSQPRPKVCQCFRVLLSAHTLQRQLLACSRRTSLSVRSYPPLPLQIRRHVMLSSGRENLTGRRRDESCSTPGSFWRHISAVEVFLENLTDTKLKSKRLCRCPRPL